MSVNKLSQRRFTLPMLGIPSIYLRKLNSWQDACILALIALIGLLGSIYLFRSAMDEGIFHRVNTLEARTDLSKHQMAAAVLKQEYECTKPCTVKGVPIVGSELEFYLHSYRSDAEYVADFGNGDKQMISGDQFTYSYPTAGIYDVRLEVSYRGKSKTLYSETIVISSGTD